MPWTSSLIVGLLALSAIVGALFVVRLLTAPEPLIPLTIMKDPVARYSIATNSLRLGRRSSRSTCFCRSICRTCSACRATRAGLSLMVLMGVLNASAGFTSPLIGRHAATRSCR